MATRFLTRSLPIATRQTLASTVSRSYAAVPSAGPPSSFYVLCLRPLFVAASVSYFRRRLTPAFATRGLSTSSTLSSLNDPDQNSTNRHPREMTLLDGCDFEHWLVVMRKPEGEPTRDEIIDIYIKTLAMVVGSEEEARMRIYSVSTQYYYAFGALMSEELSEKLNDSPNVGWVLPDSYLDVKNKDYGGEPFINGQAVPYDPEYHKEWVGNNDQVNYRNESHFRSRGSRIPPVGRMGEPLWEPPIMGGPPHTGAPTPPNVGRMQQQRPPPNYAGDRPNDMGGYLQTDRSPPHNNAENYPGEPFINGQAVPYDPKYHEEWVRNNAQVNDRNRRHYRSRNWGMQNSGAPPGGRMGDPPYIWAPPIMGGPPNTGAPAPPNMRGMQQQQQQPPPNYPADQPNDMGGYPQTDMAPPHNNAENYPGV